MKKLYASFFLCSLFFSGWGTAFAEDGAPTPSTLPDVFLSEVNWAGSSLSNADEWLEISNRSREVVDLGGWILDGAASSGQALQLEAGTLIDPYSTLLIANYDIGNEKTTLATSPDIASSSVSLSNSNLLLRLINPSGIVVDSFDLSEHGTGSSNPFTSALRLDDGTWSDSTASQNLLESAQLGTPGVYDFTLYSSEPFLDDTPEEVSTEVTTVVEDPACCGCSCPLPAGDEEIISSENSTAPEEDEAIESVDPVVDTADSPSEEVAGDDVPSAAEPEVEEQTAPLNQDSLLLHEFVSDPVDSTEWIEIFNNSSIVSDLSGTSLEDAAGGVTFLEGTIDPFGYFVIKNPKGKLNNSGDTISLFGADGSLLDSVSYGDALLSSPKKGESAGLIGEEWVVLLTPSPGSENIANPVEESIIEDTDSLMNNDEGSEVEATSAEPTIEEGGDLDAPTVAPSDPGAPETVTIVSQIGSSEESSSRASSAHSSSRGPDSFVASGIVTVPPGIAGKQRMYLDGYQVYFHRPDWPESIEVGHRVRVEGVLDDSNGERRVKINSKDSISVLDMGALEIEPFSSELLSSEHTGSLIQFDAAVQSRSARFLNLVQDGFSFRVHLPDSLNGNTIPSDHITGHGALRANKDGYYLDILDATDIQYPSPVTLTEAASSEAVPDIEQSLEHAAQKRIAGAGIFTGTLGMLGFWLRKSILFS